MPFHPMTRRAALAAALILAATPSYSQSESQETVRIGLQRSSTLTAILRANGELEKALAPLKVRVSWHEFTSGLPLLEALNLGNVDVSADVADTVPVFAQAAGAKLVYFAEETASPAAQAIVIPANSSIKSVADLKGKKIAVTKGAGSHYLLLAALKDAGVNFKEISPAYLTAADGRAASSATTSMPGWRGIPSSPSRSANPERRCWPTARIWPATNAIISHRRNMRRPETTC